VPEIVVVRSPIPRADLASRTLDGNLVKAVVDVERSILAVGGDMHSDEEEVLLNDGSRQRDLWGINLLLDQPAAQWLEFDSMINLRPSQGNRSRGVDDPAVRTRIRSVVDALVQG